MRFPFFAAVAAAVSFALPAGADSYRDTSVPIGAVPVDLDRYLGKWHEVARYPNWFERNCASPTATYSRNDDGTVKVLNACAGGRSREALATPTGPGKLEVDFFQGLPGIAKGQYWVLYVDPDYSLAVVGEPSGRYGWILSRTPGIRQSELDRATTALEKNGYDTAELVIVP
ncbi:lipocalin family protein [Maritimibacter sp. DP1N21-5]|uniref:lipocalin family protein n=1 Tax=Maritimibacter sp. DP1N21-5 TaxID=2836867 RepID=UPI001C48F5E6|nr:lipocalin family protein [Maritimibacter sp. DP1N21-5]MBV7409335.1 lipocalin family protein [Maritimibacter sp. DP1N21-5]